MKRLAQWVFNLHCPKEPATVKRVLSWKPYWDDGCLAWPTALVTRRGSGVSTVTPLWPILKQHER